MYFYDAEKNLKSSDHIENLFMGEVAEEEKGKLKINSVNVSHNKPSPMVKLNTTQNEGRFLNILFKRLRTFNDNEIAENVFILNFILQLTALPNYINTGSNNHFVIDENILISILKDIKDAVISKPHGKNNKKVPSIQTSQIDSDIQTEDKELTVIQDLNVGRSQNCLKSLRGNII